MIDLYDSNLNVFHVFTRLVIFSWGFSYTSLNAGTVGSGGYSGSGVQWVVLHLLRLHRAKLPQTGQGQHSWSGQP